MEASIPERAIRAFEAVHGLLVTVHDCAGRLWPHLAPERLFHRHRRCQAVKALGFEASCIEFDNIRLRPALEGLPAGRMHRCHAGFLEWVVPCLDGQGRVEVVLFAGLADWTGEADVLAAPWRSTRLPPWRDGLALPAVDAGRGELVLECLRQLASRLSVWLAGERGAGARASEMPTPSEPLAQRRSLIVHWVRRHQAEQVGLPDLARHLGLSTSRAGHAVRELCGCGFVELLRGIRLDSASALLRQTGLGVAEVAVRSGFGDVAYFHRVFRRRFGVTPSRWRQGGVPG